MQTVAIPFLDSRCQPNHVSVLPSVLLNTEFVILITKMPLPLCSGIEIQISYIYIKWQHGVTT